MIQPVGNRVLVKPISPDDKSQAGLIISTIEDEKQDKGTVVAIGDGVDVKRFSVGDVLIYQRYGPAEVMIDKEKLVIVYLDEILGVLT